MFATALREAREDAHLTVAELAIRASTSRAAITEYESGRKVPRVDTAERLLRAAGEEYVALTAGPAHRVRIAADALAPLEAWQPDRDAALAAARDDLALLVDADANAERLEVTWGQVKTVVDGTTVDGDELSVWRLHDLHVSARTALGRIENGIEPRLRVVARDRLITADLSTPTVPRRAMDFLVRATEAGADAALIRHRTGSYLAHHGYPWLWVPHRLGSDYRRALVACRRQSEGSAMVRVLTASISRG